MMTGDDWWWVVMTDNDNDAHKQRPRSTPSTDFWQHWQPTKTWVLSTKICAADDGGRWEANEINSLVQVARWRKDAVTVYVKSMLTYVKEKQPSSSRQTLLKTFAFEVLLFVPSSLVLLACNFCKRPSQTSSDGKSLLRVAAWWPRWQNVLRLCFVNKYKPVRLFTSWKGCCTLHNDPTLWSQIVAVSIRLPHYTRKLFSALYRSRRCY